MEVCERRPKTSVPCYYDFLEDPQGFITRGLERKKLRNDFNELKKERAEIKKRLASIADLKKNMLASYDGYTAKLVEQAKKFISHNRNNKDPFEFLQKRGDRHGLHNFIPFSIFEAALDDLTKEDEPDAITEAQRSKQIAEIEKKMEVLKSELTKHSPPKDFDFNKGEVDGDKAKIFMDYWANLQFWTRGEVGPQGLALRYSPEPEMRAYYKLGLDKIRNPKAVKLPAEP